MSIKTVLLVALALLPLLTADGLHASPACGATTVSPSLAPAFFGPSSPDTLVDQSQAEAFANDGQTAGVVTADFTVAAAERQPRVIFF